jgi:hypothetical protein
VAAHTAGELLAAPNHNRVSYAADARGADAEKTGPESVRIVNRCRTQCVGEIRWLHMTKVSKQGKLTNPNTDAHTPETASNVGTGYEVGRAAVTAITMLAQTTHRICRPKVERAHRPPDDRVFIG